MSYGIVVASIVAAIASMAVAAIQSRRAIHQRLDSLTSIAHEHKEYWDDFHSRGWHNLPEGSENAIQLVVTLTNLSDAVGKLREELADHVEWEMNQKYKDPQ